MSVTRESRFTRSNLCPVCGGHDGMPRGNGTRCHGFLSEDGRYAHCSRDEHAGGLPQDDAQTYAHLLGGSCRCGQTHVSTPVAGGLASARRLDRVLSDTDFQRCPSPYPCDYVDEASKILYRVARWQRPDGTKTYSFHHPDGNGGWLAGRGNAPRVLYGLPAVREGVAKSEVHVAEGEKKVHLLLALRLVATCNDGGAGKFTAAHAEALHGARRIVVWGDNDAPGRRHVEQVCRLLHEAGFPEVLVPVIPGLAEGKGFDDWLAREDPVASVEAVRALVKVAPRWETTVPAAKKRAVLTRFSEVEPLPVAWLWQGWIPLGMLSVLDGDPGLGKSTLLLDIAARVSRGDVMPDGSPGPEAAGVVVLSAEDPADRVIRPRLDAAQADVGRVAMVHINDSGGGRRDPVLTPGDLVEVEAEMQQFGARLLIVDPLMPFLPEDVNAHRDQDVRRALVRLRDLAERTGAAVVVVRHLNKSPGGNPLYRGGGSIGIIGAARAGFLLARDPEDREVRVLAVTKSNLAPAPAARRLRLVNDERDSPARVSWEGESDQTAASLLAEPADPEGREAADEQRGAVDEAEEFLREILAPGPVLSVEVKREAGEVGVSWAATRRAKQRLGVRAGKVAGGRWEWTLHGGAQGARSVSDSIRPPLDERLEHLEVSGVRKQLAGADENRAAQGAQGVGDGSPGEQIRSVETSDGEPKGEVVGECLAPCAFCGGRVLEWDFGSACSSCRRRQVPERGREVADV